MSDRTSRKTHSQFCPVTVDHREESACACAYIEAALISERDRIQVMLSDIIWHNRAPMAGTIMELAEPDSRDVTKGYAEGRDDR